MFSYRFVLIEIFKFFQMIKVYYRWLVHGIRLPNTVLNIISLHSLSIGFLGRANAKANPNAAVRDAFFGKPMNRMHQDVKVCID